jgi:hypothetical protein
MAGPGYAIVAVDWCCGGRWWWWWYPVVLDTSTNPFAVSLTVASDGDLTLPQVVLAL